MDHITLPSDNVGHSPLEVPYLESQQFQYDDLGMLLYPQRSGIDPELLALNEEPCLGLYQSAQFIQAWLWFGMLGECLRVGFRNTQAPRRTNYDIFIKQTSHGKFVSLVRLREVIASENESISPLFREWRNYRLLNCMHIANKFVRQAIATLHHSGPRFDERAPLEPIFLVLLSVQILIQTLVDSTEGLRRLKQDGHVATDDMSVQLVDLLLTCSGWCLLDIEHLPKSPIFRYYLTYFRQNSCLHQMILRGHDEKICSNRRTSQDTCFAPKHTHRQCFCPLISVPFDAIDQIEPSNNLDTNIFHEYNSDSRCLHQTAQSLNTELINPYVAISHIRSVGLGNDDGNALPHCQLSLVQALANQVVKPKHESGSTPFWIDTLGLPVDRKSRERAIRYIPLIFTRASAVIVLDPTLYKHAYTQAGEAILRIRYSLWKSRLWTLEEGFCSRKLVFRFSNALVSLEELLSRVQPTLILSAGRINRSFSILDLMRHEDLARVLTGFASDIHLAIELGLDIDQERLYRVLRAGYLSSKKFSFCIEENEWEFQQNVMPGVLEIYNSQEDLSFNIHSVSRRLSKISNGARGLE